MEKNSNISRRSFLTKSAMATAAFTFGGNIPNLLASQNSIQKNGKLSELVLGQFPKDFMWGTATAAYQVEGAVNEDGRGKSIWDTFSHTPGKTKNGDTGDVSCNQYHLYEDDIKLMVDLGIKHYRFSIAWPRIIPEGRGKVNEKGVDYYKRLTDALLKNGITPHATLYHWDLPQALQDKYKGWQSREIANDFGDYASTVVNHLGDKINNWITINEISSMAYVGYKVYNSWEGSQAPGVQLASVKERNQIIHNILLAHGTAIQAIRASSPRKTNISFASSHENYVPFVETPENIEAARKVFVRSQQNGGILVPILTGNYDEGWMKDMGVQCPDIQSGDMKIISQPLDSIGFNCYTATYVRAASNEKGYEEIPFPKNYPTGNMDWLKIVPESIYWGIRFLKEALHCDKLPVFVSENGISDGGELVNGQCDDLDRIMYYRQHLHNVKRAINEGYPVVGYFPWSLLDNFEWSAGYSKRFGMVRVDYDTLKRTPKLSYHWYKEVIKNGRVM
jgi:beta-glucosidase